MGIFDLFGKQKISEKAAAQLYVRTAVEDSQQRWPHFALELSQMFPEEKAFINTDAQIEFSIAVTVMQLQVLPYILSCEQACRVLQHVLYCFPSSSKDGKYMKTSIQEYQNAWNQALEQLEMPTTAIASVLFDRLGWLIVAGQIGTVAIMTAKMVDITATN